jgi:hypothetical protein
MSKKESNPDLTHREVHFLEVPGREMRAGFRIEGDIEDIEDVGPGPELLLELVAIISNGATCALVRD